MEFKSGFVSVIGRPNVGKSTLINKIVGQKISIISAKPQTTRYKFKLIYTSDKGQIIFIDTPGIHKAQNALDEYMLDEAFASLKGIDVILFLVDATSPYGKGDNFVFNEIKNINTSLIVAMNKIDCIDKDSLIKRKDKYEKKLGHNVIPVSATQKINFDTLLKTIFDKLPSGPQYYPEDMITDQLERFIVQEIVREKIFKLTRDEIPYGTAVLVEEMEEREENQFYIRANIFVEKKSHKGIIIGKNGKMIKEIGKKARQDMEKMLQANVYLDLWVKIEKNWREKKYLIERMGYK